MKRNLKDYVGKSQLLESYSIGFLEPRFKIDSKSEAEGHLIVVAELLQLMASNSEYYDNIDKIDLFELGLFFSDKYVLRNKKDED